MSRRQRTILTISLRIPMPAGKTQAKVIEDVKQALTTTCNLIPAYPTSEMIIKVVGREVTYL